MITWELIFYQKYAFLFNRVMQVTHCERRSSQLEALNKMPLYPTEDIIWDENVVPMEYFTGEGMR